MIKKIVISNYLVRRVSKQFMLRFVSFGAEGHLFVHAYLCLCYDILLIQAAAELWSAVRLDEIHSFVNLNGIMHHALREPADQSIEKWRTLPRGVFNGTAGLQM